MATMSPTGTSGRTRPGRAGLTVLELLIVLGIIAGIMAVLAGALFSMSDSEEANTRACLETMKSGLVKYQERTGRFPDPSTSIPNTTIDDPSNPTVAILVSAATSDPYEQLYLFLTSHHFTKTGGKAPLVESNDASKFTEKIGAHTQLVFRDAWGKEIEFVAQSYATKNPQLCLRSAGPDGIFDTDDPDRDGYTGDDVEIPVFEGRW